MIFASGPLAVGSLPLGSTATGEVYCQTLKASSAVQCTSGTVTASTGAFTNLTIAGSPLPELSYYGQSGGESFLFGPSSSVAWTSGVTVTQQTGYQVLNITGFAQSPVVSSIPVGIAARFSFELRRHSSTSLNLVTLHVNAASTYTGAVAGQFPLTDQWIPHSINFTSYSSGMAAVQIGNSIGGLPQTLGIIEIRNVAFQSAVGSSNLSQNLTVNGNAQAVAFTSTSDASIKAGATIAPQDACRQIFDAVQAQTYTRTDGPEGKRIGFLAQDVEAALGASSMGITNIVTRDVSDPSLLALDYIRLLPILWQTTKALQERIAALEAAQSSTE